MFVRQVVGVVATIVAFGPIVLASGVLRRKLLPGWFGPPAFLARLVVVAVTSLLSVEVLGLIGWYRVVPTVALLALVGVAAWWAALRLPQRDGERLPDVPQRLGTPATVLAAGIASITAAVWGARTFVALNHGMVSIDSLWYHLPASARFADSGSIVGIHHDAVELSGYYPVATELLHSLGMVLLGNDTFSMIMNLGWGAIVLVAAWCIGRPHGVAVVTMSSAAVLLCAPGFVATQPGAAHTDVVGLAWVLIAVALLVTADCRRITTDPVVLVTAGLAFGAAVGTKWTVLPLAGVLTLGVVVYLLRQRRFSLAGLVVAPLAVVGCFTYLQNWIVEGNPLPPIELKLAGVGFDAAVPPAPNFDSLWSFVFDRSVWSEQWFPGFDLWFGVAWWGVLALAALGLLLAIATGSGYLTRMLGVAGAMAGVAYVASPQFLTIGGRIYYFYFVGNLRYAAAALTFGLILLPIARPLNGAWRSWFPMGLFAALIVTMQLDPTIWPTELRDTRYENPVRGVDAVVGVVIGVVVFVGALGFLWYRSRDARRDRSGAQSSDARGRLRTVGWLATIGVAAVGLFFAQHYYVARRYNRPDASVPWQQLHWKSWQYFRDTANMHIGTRNTTLFYPLLGNELSNHVERVGGREDLGYGLAGPSPDVATCEAWREELNAADLDYVVIYGTPARLPLDHESVRRLPEVRWLLDDPAVSVPLEGNQEIVFQISGPLDPSTCTS